MEFFNPDSPASEATIQLAILDLLMGREEAGAKTLREFLHFPDSGRVQRLRVSPFYRFACKKFSWTEELHWVEEQVQDDMSRSSVFLSWHGLGDYYEPGFESFQTTRDALDWAYFASIRRDLGKAFDLLRKIKGMPQVTPLGSLR